MKKKLNSGHLVQLQEAVLPSEKAEFSCLIVYEGTFNSLDGEVTVDAEGIKKVAENYNAKLAACKKTKEGTPYPYAMAPVQLDHADSSTMTVGRVVGPVEIKPYTTDEGQTVNGLYSKIRILGRDNVDRVRDGRWSSLSIGADFESGILSEVTITPFPAAPEASIINLGAKKMGIKKEVMKYMTEVKEMEEKEAEEKYKLLDDEQREYMAKKMRQMDKDPAPEEGAERVPSEEESPGSVRGGKKMSDPEGGAGEEKEEKKEMAEGEEEKEEKKLSESAPAVLSQEQMEQIADMMVKKMEAMVKAEATDLEEGEKEKTEMAEGEEKEEEKKEMAEGEEEEEEKLAGKRCEENEKEEKSGPSPKTIKEVKKSMGSARERNIARLAADYNALSKKTSLQLMKTKLSSRLASLRAKGKITPAEISKIDLDHLASQGQKVASAVLSSYESREPVIHAGVLGTTSAVSLSEINKLSRQRDSRIMELRTKLNVKSALAAGEEAAIEQELTRLTQGDAQSVQEFIPTASLNKEEIDELSDKIERLMDGGDLKQAKKLMRESFSQLKRLRFGDYAHSGSDSKRIEEIEEHLSEMNEAFARLLKTLN